MSTREESKKPSFDIDKIPLTEHEVEIPLFSSGLTDAEKRGGTPEEIQAEAASRAWKAYVDAALKIKAKNPGLLFKHLISPKEGYMWVMAYYDEEFIYSPELIQADIENFEREVKQIIIVARDPKDADEAKQLWSERKAELQTWIREYRRRIYHLVRRDVGSATNFFTMMPPEMLEKILVNLTNEVNKKRKALLKNTDRCKSLEGAKIVSDTRRPVERTEQSQNTA